MDKPKKSKMSGDKKEVVKYSIKTSDDCMKCKNKCAAGEKYLKMMSRSGSKGNGVVCKYNEKLL